MSTTETGRAAGSETEGGDGDEDAGGDQIFGVPRRRYYLSGSVVIVSGFLFFLALLSVVQLVFVYPPGARPADGLLGAYVGLGVVSMMATGVSGAYLGVSVYRGLDLGNRDGDTRD